MKAYIVRSMSYDYETDTKTEQIETRRTDRKAAEEDVSILTFIGKKAWIEETEGGK